MRITILGTGGFLNESLPYNALYLEGGCLLETPPDIVPSLARQALPLGEIRDIFISHSHGDHLFGAPFLLFQLWKASPEGPGPRILGPSDIKARLLDLARLAIRESHPYVAWIAERCAWETVEAGSRAEIGGREAEFYPMFHERETLGLGLREAGELRFQYLPDSRWDEAVGACLGLGARIAVCDINGTGADRSVHLGVEDLVPCLPALRAAGTRLVGTHLSREPESLPPGIELARPGMVLEA
jgi:hypothetical protein